MAEIRSFSDRFYISRQCRQRFQQIVEDDLSNREELHFWQSEHKEPCLRVVSSPLFHRAIDAKRITNKSVVFLREEEEFTLRRTVLIRFFSEYMTYLDLFFSVRFFPAY